jgi:hypothetical protein
MEKIFTYNKNIYNFLDHIKPIFNNIELNQLHTQTNKEYEIPIELGSDTSTEFHNIFYKYIRENGEELKKLYIEFIEEYIYPLIGEDEILYQKFPSFRIQLPNNKAVCSWHSDGDKDNKHPNGEINFIIPLTDCYDTNTVWTESEPNKKDYHPINMKYGELLRFNGNKCSHGNKVNKTNVTRVSMDFRILPKNKYDENYEVKTSSTKQKYIIGGYYELMSSKINHKSLQNSRNDAWDRAKIKFNNKLEKYNVSDPWDIVDLFEKKIAKYSGSKYAVSVDNCTNAMFLCLKYLNASGYVTIPKNTYVSVPNTIINAGCKVKFEDIKWSGVYQLEPYPIYDSATKFKKNMYIKNSFYCLSFHIRKHLPIGKGGMILTDDINAYKYFKCIRYEGRHLENQYQNDYFDIIGYNMYLTPEQASKGLELFENMNDYNPNQGSSETYSDLSKFKIFTK